MYLIRNVDFNPAVCLPETRETKKMLKFNLNVNGNEKKIKISQTLKTLIKLFTIRISNGIE